MQTSTVFIRQLRSKRANVATHKQTDFSVMSNQSLKFALDVLSLHYSPLEVEAANEIQKRIIRGVWFDQDEKIIPKENLPAWLKVFPFCLLWKQRPR